MLVFYCYYYYIHVEHANLIYYKDEEQIGCNEICCRTGANNNISFTGWQFVQICSYGMPKYSDKLCSDKSLTAEAWP